VGDRELGSFVIAVDCLHSRKPERRTEGKPLLQLANIREDGILDMLDTYLISQEDYGEWTSRMEARPGDCVITNVGREEEIERKTDSGTILDSLNVRNIPRLRTILPPASSLKAFERICRPLRARMEQNQEETMILAALRDALLPKLLSGEIRVKQAEKIVGEVV
jgi:type I restriction enzyme, S subunit